MIARPDAELGYVMSLLLHDDEEFTEAPMMRYFDCATRIEPADIQNNSLRSLLYCILGGFKGENSTSLTLAAQYLQQPLPFIQGRAAIIDYKATDQYAREILNHLERQSLTGAAASVDSIASDDDLTAEEKLTKMREQLAQVEVDVEEQRLTTVAGMDERWYSALQQRQADIAAGVVRMTFPGPWLDRIEDHVPYLFNGDMILVTAESGVGKSSFGGQFFDGNLQRGLPGIRFRFEDSDEKAGARRALRTMSGAVSKEGELLGVPSDRLMGPVVLKDKEWKVIRHSRGQLDGWAERGIEVFCYGWDMERVVSLLRRFKMTHDIKFAIFDYLNKATLSSTKLRGYGLFGARGQDAELIKTATEELGIVSLLIQQENPISKMPFETTMSLQKSQVWVSLRRELDDETGERPDTGIVWIRKANMGKTIKLKSVFASRFLMWKID